MLVRDRKKSYSKIRVINSIRSYRPIDKINKGTFGEVSMYSRDGQEYAVKRFTNKKQGAVHLTTVRELKALILLDGIKHISRIEEIVIEDTELYVVFPLYKETLMGKRYEYLREASEHFRQIVVGIQSIHQHKLIHRDLKSSNIMLDSNNVIKIIDFGMSRKIQPMMSSIVTTLWYRAPELLEFGTKNVYTEYKYAIDTWSIGIVLLEMLLGHAPCKSNCEVEQLALYKKNLSNIKDEYYWLPDSAVDLLTEMLKFDPKERIGLDRILKHPFITECDQSAKMFYLSEKKCD
ncbi:Y8H9 [Enterospora canceri]|uniref:Y8H9 n=1 Tax=Enterospora canceri TaxID=1081671 RepID=A0A1Y1S9I2_9MICR|nr:Y8H9 [Enterospora canceri]